MWAATVAGGSATCLTVLNVILGSIGTVFVGFIVVKMPRKAKYANCSCGWMIGIGSRAVVSRYTFEDREERGMPCDPALPRTARGGCCRFRPTLLLHFNQSASWPRTSLAPFIFPFPHFSTIILSFFNIIILLHLDAFISSPELVGAISPIPPGAFSLLPFSTFIRSSKSASINYIKSCFHSLYST
jgi:hypothetical protein